MSDKPATTASSSSTNLYGRGRALRSRVVDTTATSNSSISSNDDNDDDNDDDAEGHSLQSGDQLQQRPADDDAAGLCDSLIN